MCLATSAHLGLNSDMRPLAFLVFAVQVASLEVKVAPCKTSSAWWWEMVR